MTLSIITGALIGAMSSATALAVAIIQGGGL